MTPTITTPTVLTLGLAPEGADHAENEKYYRPTD
jgi:hypothetical protein